MLTERTRRAAQLGLDTILKMVTDDTPTIVVLARTEVNDEGQTEARGEIYIVHDYWPSPDFEAAQQQRIHAETRLAAEAVANGYNYGCLWVHTITNDTVGETADEEVWGVWRRPMDGVFSPDDGEEEQFFGLVFDLGEGIDIMRTKIIRVGGVCEHGPIEIVSGPAYIDPANPGITLVRELSASLEK